LLVFALTIPGNALSPEVNTGDILCVSRLYIPPVGQGE